jgi:hypothetical protein
VTRQESGSTSDPDINFYFDPVCPFAWMTSKWVRMVAAQRDYAVDWRFISLRMINSGIDYDSHFPVGYEEGHTSGLRLIRSLLERRLPGARFAFLSACSTHHGSAAIPDETITIAAANGCPLGSLSLMTSTGTDCAQRDPDLT